MLHHGIHSKKCFVLSSCLRLLMNALEFCLQHAVQRQHNSSICSSTNCYSSPTSSVSLSSHSPPTHSLSFPTHSTPPPFLVSFSPSSLFLIPQLSFSSPYRGSVVPYSPDDFSVPVRSTFNYLSMSPIGHFT